MVAWPYVLYKQYMMKNVSLNRKKDIIVYIILVVLSVVSTIPLSKSSIPGDSIMAAIFFNLLSFPLGLLWSMLFAVFTAVDFINNAITGPALDVFAGSGFILVGYIQWFVIFERFNELVRLRHFALPGLLLLPLILSLWKVYGMLSQKQMVQRINISYRKLWLLSKINQSLNACLERFHDHEEKT